MQWQVHGYEAKPAFAACNPAPPRAQTAGNVVRQASGPEAKVDDEDEMSCPPVVDIQWPKFKTRRLIGGWTGDHCPVGLPAKACKFQHFIGEVAYGKVYRDKFGGQ